MDAEVVGLPDQTKRQAKNFLAFLVVEFGEDGFQVDGFAAARVGMPAARNQGGQLFDAGFVEAEGFGGFAHGRFGLHGADGGDKGNPVGAVGAAHVMEHFIAAAAAKIEVNIGQTGARGVEESFEQQSVGDRIDGGDAQRVGDQRIGDAAACADGHGRFPRIAHHIGHHQEERREAVAVNCRQFVSEAGFVIWGWRFVRRAA